MSQSIFSELKRRNVIRVAAMYAVMSWLLLQIGDVVFPALRLPEWSITMLIAFLAVGLPIALLFAWIFEVTPQGITRTENVPETASIAASTGQKINYLIIATLALAVVVLLVRTIIVETRDPIPTAVLPIDRSIAVLPFKNQSAGGENAEFFAGGLHDELLTLLSRLGELRVISRTSVERLDVALSVPEIGELLGVATVLEGQVQRSGDQLRINVQLINAATEDHIWANTYDSRVTAENIFSLQSEISRTIAMALEARLSSSDEEALADLPTSNTEAYEHYLLADQLLKRGTVEALIQAKDYLLEATRLDPGFARAWAMLADAYDRLLATGAVSVEEYLNAAKPAVDTAIRLNANLPRAQAALADYLWRSGNEEQARTAFADALRNAPDDPTILESYGTFLRTYLDLEPARQLLSRAATSNPLDIDLLYELGRVEMWLGNPRQLLGRAERIREISPSAVQGYVAVVQAVIWMGRYDLYWEWMHKALGADRLDVEIWAHLAAAAEELGASDWADGYAARADSLQPGHAASLRARVLMQLKRGEFDAALAIARQALDAGLDDRWGSDEVFLRTVRDHAIRSRQYEPALNYYRARHPGLFADSPEFTAQDVVFADDLALLLRHAGDEDRANHLLDAAIDRYDAITPDGVHGIVTGITDVELFALAGRHDEALDALSEAVRSGWRILWPWVLEGENLASIRESERFRELKAELAEDTAIQLEKIRAMPALGPYDLRSSE